MKKVLIIQRILPHYRINFFKQLENLLNKNQISLRIIAGQPRSNEFFNLDNKSKSNVTNIKNLYFGKKLYLSLVNFLKFKQYDLIIVEQCNSAILNYLIFIFYNKKKIAFWGHGKNLNTYKKKYFSNFIRKCLLTQINHFFAYTKISAKIIRNMGFNKDNITIINNSIDLDDFENHINDISKSALESSYYGLFKKNRRSDDIVGIFCGRLVELKNIPLLLEAITLIHQRYKSFKMIIIGDGNYKKLVDEFSKKNNWCVSIGSVYEREKALYFSHGDIFINTGMTGLAILDAFRAKLPYITMDNKIHSPEIAYLENGINGFISKNCKDDLVNCIYDIVSDRKKISKMKNEAYKSSKIYDSSNMVSNYLKGILKILN